RLGAVEPATGPIGGEFRWKVSRSRSSLRTQLLPLPPVLIFLEHVLDGGLVNHQVWTTIFSDHLDATLVIPFDDAVHFFAVTQHNHHRRSRLLLVIKILRVSLLRWCALSSAAPTSAHGTIATVAAIITTIRPALHSTFRALVPLPALCHLHMAGIMVGVVIAVIMVHARQRGTDQLAVGKIVLFVRRLDWGRIHCLFHSGATPAHPLAQTATSKEPLRVFTKA